MLPDLTLPGHPEVFAVGDMARLNKLPGVGEVAMQGGLHAANSIVRRPAATTDTLPFTYRDLGSVATIGRFQAICSVGGIRLSGFPAWVVWMFVHLAFLNGFGDRISTMAAVVAVAVGPSAGRAGVQHRPHRRRPEHAGVRAGPDRTQPVPRRVRPTRRLRRLDRGSSLASILAVNPVPWARAQMAFTLAFHIMLVPLGVSWAFMALIANYRGIKHDDADAMRLAQRWSKYMAVTFAVGAVTGTVLSFEFGLLWPRFMGQWGEAFGVPFAFEGLFFFTEAIFVAIYIFGWRRLKPWAPLLDRRARRHHRHPRQRVGGRRQRLDELPVRLHARLGRQDRRRRPVEVIFNDAMPLMAAHMVVAAYVVGGFLIASVYAVGMLRGRRDRYHRLGFMIPFTVAAVAIPIQMGVGDSLARWVYNNQPMKFAAIELVPDDVERRARDAVRPPQLGRHGLRRHPDPRPGVDPVRSRPTARPR